jgi:hypothetical protein
MEFSSKLYLPILKEEIRYTHLNNSNYLDILKFVTNNDDNGLINYFNDILKYKIYQSNIVNKLSNIEKFLILLDLRSILLGEKLQLVNSNNTNIDLSISSMRDNLIKNISNINLIKYVEYNNIKLTLSIPKSLDIENIDQIYKELINEITINEDIIDFSSLTDEEKESIIASIPANLANELLSFIDFCQKMSETINIINGNERLGIDNIPLRVFDKTMFSFLKNTFGNDLMSFYELQFNMMSKLHVSSDNFMKMTPNECKIFINFFNQDMKRQEDAQKSSNSTPSMPSMPRAPKFN